MCQKGTYKPLLWASLTDLTADSLTGPTSRSKSKQAASSLSESKSNVHTTSTLLSSRKAASPSATSPDSPLLVLPPELRNRVYEYALTSDDVLDMTKVKGIKIYHSTIKSANPRVHFNSLALVCKQLHSETKGMEFRLNNTIGFGEGNMTLIQERFLEFYESADGLKKAWSCTFILEGCYRKSSQRFNTSDWMLEQSTKFVQLLWAAKLSPQMKIHLFLPGFAFVGKARDQPQKLVEGAHLLKRAIRGISCSEYYRNRLPSGFGVGKTSMCYWEFNTSAQLHGGLYQISVQRLGQKTLNLRVFPADKVFNAELFEAKAKEPFQDIDKDDATQNEDLAAWTSWVQEIYNNGL
ncbi:hypothetical protein SLS60_003476 [Paraconiothyrium brasiliense]|uniref:Uncharacterized protein n=1 Tax=Paraconiothyrium brasiliense TaxID=300254 RepID=A0ABR3RWU8_9PLEO